VSSSLQWGGRFSAPPDRALLAFGSSLEEDLVLAPFDVRCSQAHVAALRGGVLSAADADALERALQIIASEIEEGAFITSARASGAEDVHGAIDACIRALAPEAGELLHAGRSRNDQVATTLLLYCADRASRGKALATRIAGTLATQAREHLSDGTLLAGTTHWQPAQPVLLAFWLCAAAEPFVRDARRFDQALQNAMQACPLGSAALAGSSLNLDRAAAAQSLGFTAPSRNAMDAIGNRDAALDTAHAHVRAVLDASRVSEELILWCTPAFGYARLGDAASTGSSLMPQKRNPDPFELVRGASAALIGEYAGALASTSGLALSYHRDLQVTKAAVLAIVERALAVLDAFAGALTHVQFDVQRMTEAAGNHYTVATDVADAFIASGVTARAAHARVGETIRASEESGVLPDWPDARASVEGKVTIGSTAPGHVEATLAAIERDLAEMQA
jgi:argininosuccinate lyase